MRNDVKPLDAEEVEELRGYIGQLHDLILYHDNGSFSVQLDGLLATIDARTAERDAAIRERDEWYGNWKERDADVTRLADYLEKVSATLDAAQAELAAVKAVLQDLIPHVDSTCYGDLNGCKALRAACDVLGWRGTDVEAVREDILGAAALAPPSADLSNTAGDTAPSVSSIEQPDAEAAPTSGGKDGGG